MRLKLPAYAKRLLDERRAGRHPLDLSLVYGEQWLDVADPKICVKPPEYEKGKFDFAVTAGVRTTVIDQAAAGADYADKFYDLLRELADVGAQVRVHTPIGAGREFMTALEIADGLRSLSADGKTWPRWWDDAIDARQRAGVWLWLEDKRKRRNGRIAA